MLSRWLLRFVPAALSVAALGCQTSDEDASTKDDDICVAGVGDCSRTPSVACESELGKRVVARVMRADFTDSTVPRDLVYSGRNADGGALVDAIQVFPKMADLIASAQREVDFESFEWAPWHFDFTRDALRADAAGLAHDPPRLTDLTRDPTAVILSGLVRLEDRLKDEASRGAEPALPVRVYFAINGAAENAPMGGDTAISKIAMLRRQLDALALDSRYVEVHVAAHGAWLGGASHSKFAVVDGYRALITGVNPQSQQTLGSSWHDSGYLMTGDAGIALRRSFDVNWESSTEVLSCPPGSPPAKGSCKTQPTRPIVHAPEVEKPAFEAELAGACLPVMVVTRKPAGMSGGLSTLNPLANTSPQAHAFLALMDEAKSVLKIESPNLNAPAAKRAIVDAAKRGVRVQVVLSMGFNADGERKLGGANEDTVRELYKTLAGEPGCNKLEVRWHSADGRRPTWANQTGATHTKYLSVDSQIVMVGSANQDLASWGFAYEANLVIDDAKTTRSYDAAMFDADWARAIPVTDWAKSVQQGGAVKDGEQKATDADLAWLLGKDPKGWLADVAGACK